MIRMLSKVKSRSWRIFYHLVKKIIGAIMIFVIILGVAGFRLPKKAEAVVAVFDMVGVESGDMLEACTTLGGASTADTSVKRSGTYSYKIAYTSAASHRTITLGIPGPVNGSPACNGNLGSPIYVSLFFQISALPSSGTETLGALITAGSAQIMRWGVNSSGNILVYDSKTPETTLGTSTTAISVNTWYRLDIKGSKDEGGAWAIKIYNDPVTGNGRGSPRLTARQMFILTTLCLVALIIRGMREF